MKLTDEWIMKNKPCKEALDWWNDKERDAATLVRKLIAEEKLDWANWLLPRTMTREQYLRYGIYAAELVLPIYEKQCPDMDAPRLAIDAAIGGPPPMPPMPPISPPPMPPVPPVPPPMPPVPPPVPPPMPPMTPPMPPMTPPVMPRPTLLEKNWELRKVRRLYESLWLRYVENTGAA